MGQFDRGVGARATTRTRESWPLKLKLLLKLLDGADPAGSSSFFDGSGGWKLHVEMYRALQECVRRGLVERIGLSNYTPEDYEELMASGAVTIRPVVNQIEVSPFLHRADAIAYSRARGVVVQVRERERKVPPLPSYRNVPSEASSRRRSSRSSAARRSPTRPSARSPRASARAPRPCSCAGACRRA